MEEQKKSHVARNVIIVLIVMAILIGLLIGGTVGLVVIAKKFIKENGIDNKANEFVNELKNEINESEKTQFEDNSLVVEPSKNETKTENTSINIGGYKIASGTYIGYENMFDWEAQKSYKVEIKVTITKNSITMDGKTTGYTISGNQIIVNGMAVLQAVGTNQLQSLAQSTPILSYQGY